MTTTLSLTDCLSKFNATVADRGDENEPHVSDLYKCDRETWHRRSGKPLLGFNDDTRMKFALGNAVEAHVAKALEATLDDNWYLRTDVTCQLDGLKGHVDYLLVNEDTLEKIVVEVKSTTFFPRKINGVSRRLPPDDAQYHYKLQAAGYALALGAEQFCILIVCRDSGMVAEFWYKTKLFAAAVRARIEQVLALTDPAAPEPPADPPSFADGPKGNWMCRYCKAVTCPKNGNDDALAVPA